MEENLNDTSIERVTENETQENQKWPLGAKILICCLFLIIIGFTIFIVFYAISKSDDDEDEENKGDKEEEEDDDEGYSHEDREKAGFTESWNDLYGYKMVNLSYDKNGKIINSFKKDGENYNEDIGNMNEGKDYPKNERNVYTLYVPYRSLKRIDKYNGIFLFIHGGSWTGGKKEDIEYLSRRYAKMGYITATMGYTVLSGEYPEYNIYRILDEISSCIESIKEELEERGFNGNKLEMAIGGISAGAHISLLYGYSTKNPKIPIKFIVNIVGPLSLEPQFWYMPAINNQTLDDIEPETIDKAIEDGKIIEIFEDRVFIGLMNGFLGERYTDEEEKEMIKDNKIDQDNPKYQEMFKSVKYSFATTFIDNNTLPTLCEYAGNDSLVGVSMYKFLKLNSIKYGNIIDLVYMRYADHYLISYDTENGIEAMRDIHSQTLEYAEKYFTSD